LVAVAGWAILLATCSLLANESDELDVQVAPLGDGALHLHVHARVRASREVIWNTLTDYEHFGQFVPGLRASHVVSCQGGDCVVEQKWRIPVLWLSVPISVTVLSLERPPSTLGVHLLGGDLNRLDGAYEISAVHDGPVDLRWDGFLKGPVYLPPWISAPVVRKLARSQFRAMVAQIEQRASSLNSPRRESLLIGSVP
jgi:carbon monoxide dehydrogenase subunit G